MRQTERKREREREKKRRGRERERITTTTDESNAKVIRFIKYRKAFSVLCQYNGTVLCS